MKTASPPSVDSRPQVRGVTPPRHPGSHRRVDSSRIATPSSSRRHVELTNSVIKNVTVAEVKAARPRRHGSSAAAFKAVAIVCPRGSWCAWLGESAEEESAVRGPHEAFGDLRVAFIVDL